MKTIKAIAIKEFIHIIRDRRTLTMIIMMPMMQLMIYGYGINTDVKHMKTVVFDEDQTSLSRRLTQALQQSGYFDIRRKTSSADELYQAIDRGQAKAGLLIPPDFTRDALAGRPTHLQMLIDGTDSNPANTALNTSQAVINHFMMSEGLVPASATLTDFRPRLWYNPDLKTTFFMIPGLVGLVLQLIIPMIAATAIVREKERGNIEQILVSPIKPYEFIIGKIIPYICIGMIIASTIIACAHFLFGIPIRGNLITLFVLTLVFLTVCLGIGLFASTVAHSQQQASQIIMFFAMPSILLSGFIFPRETMPAVIYHLGHIIPLTYFVKIIRGIVLKGLGFADLWPEIVPLLLLGVVILTFSIKRFHKRLQ